MDKQLQDNLEYVKQFMERAENRRTNTFAAWAELQGYVGAAVLDGHPIDAKNLLAYMDEIKRDMKLPPAEFNRKRYGITGDEVMRDE